MGGSTEAELSVTKYFPGSGAMFTESLSVGYIFLACHGGSAKYQTCLILLGFCFSVLSFYVVCDQIYV